MMRATILSADMVGYTSLMASDALGTIELVIGCRRAIAAQVVRHRGRVLDAVGDSVLALFGRELDALRCALAVQELLSERRAHSLPPLTPHFRIGLHTGEVLIIDGRVFGTTVNVASRLQAAADCDGILVSAPVLEAGGWTDFATVCDLGRLPLKNLPFEVPSVAVWSRHENASEN